MPQDAYTLRYLCEELNLIFKGGKVNRIVQPSGDEIVFTVYTGKRTEKLLLSVNPSMPRIGVIDREKDSPLTPPNFCMLLRKHLLSATVLDMSLVGFDRIIKIDFLSSAEFFDSTVKTIYVELMGRYSNVILTQDGKVLGGNRGINMFDDGVRPLIVGKPYVFPPVGDKKLPSDQSLVGLFNGVDIKELPGLITQNVQGIAKSTAMEIVSVFDKENEQDKVDGKAFFSHMQTFLFYPKSKPCVVYIDGQVKDVLTHPYGELKGTFKHFENLYQAEDYFFFEREKEKEYSAKKERLTSIVNTAVKKIKKRLTAIKAKETDAQSCEQNRIAGELILSNIYKIKQGDKECVVFNYYDDKEQVIELDERISPSKNAEAYYKKYNKQKRTLTALKPQREQAQSQLSYFESVLDMISLAEKIIDLDLIELELIDGGFITNKKAPVKRNKQSASFRRYLIDGFNVKVGRNNTENDQLVWGAKPNDLWLHSKLYHSSHVIIESENREVPDSVIKSASELCAYYSKARNGGKTEIVYTKRKNVKKPPHAKPGFVHYDNFNSISVSPEKHEKELIE